MPVLLPYGLRKIWSHPANRAPGGLRAWVRCLGRSSAWASYQLQKQLGLFPKQGRVIPWIDGLRVRLLASSQQSQACLYYGMPAPPTCTPLSVCRPISPSCAPTCGSMAVMGSPFMTWPWPIAMA